MGSQATSSKPVVNELTPLARSHGLPFDASATGHWVRFSLGKRSVYVVRDAWGDGCSVFVADVSGNNFVQHHLRLADGVEQAARLAINYGQRPADAQLLIA